jgi:hypothetical protein
VKGGKDPGGTQDVSGTQFALLALAAADRCGLPTDRAVWDQAAQFVMSLQETVGPEVDRVVRPRRRNAPPPKPDPDAGRYAKPATESVPKDHERGFHYSTHPSTKDHDLEVTGARTACGVGALALARYALEQGAPKKPDFSMIDRSIYDGLAWLAGHFEPWSNPNGGGIRQIVYLYSVERAMDLVGAERLGEHTWYLEMVEELLQHQNDVGSWDTKDVQMGERGGPVIDTAFALLFLRRAAQGGVPAPIVTTGDDAPTR